MADPLSIAASVAGLLTLAGAVHTTVSAFIENAENAPKSARTMLMEVSLMHMTLSSLSDLVSTFLDAAQERRAIVQLDHLILAVTNAVITFSDLEDFLSRWPTLSRLPNSALVRMRWSLQDSKTRRLIERLQDARMGLSLVLNVFQCVSDFDAMRARDKLQITLDRLLQENRNLRLALQTSSDSYISNQIESSDEQTPPASTASSPHSGNWRRQSFESVLNNTWVYLRVKNNDCDMSFSTDLVKSHLGSTFTGLTLDQVSTISVVALPISWTSIVNTQWYISQNPAETVDGSETELLRESAHNIAPGDDLPLYKVTLLGEPAVGKSALVMQFCYSRFHSKHNDPTIEDIHYKTLQVDGNENQLQIVDTAGADEYSDFRRERIEEADALIIVYSIQKMMEFLLVEQIHAFIMEVKGLYNTAPIILVGTGLDDESARRVPTWHGMKLAERLGCEFFECSAKDGRNINDPFVEAIRRLKAPSGPRRGLKLLGWEGM